MKQFFSERATASPVPWRPRGSQELREKAHPWMQRADFGDPKEAPKPKRLFGQGPGQGTPIGQHLCAVAKISSLCMISEVACYS